MTYELRPDEGTAESLRRCAQEQLDSAISALTEELGADPVEAVHTARKSIKKGRALLRLARSSLPRGRRRAENQALRAAARKLTGMRDAEVMLQTLGQLSERFTGQLPDATFAAVREALERRRDALRPEPEGIGAAAEAAEELRRIRARIADWALEDRGWKGIEGGLMRTYRAGRSALRRARREPSTENLHTARRRVKDLWYELRLMAPVCGPAVRGQAQEADQVGDLLGTDHDLAVLRQTVMDQAPELAVDLDALLGLIDYHRGQLQTQAFYIAQRLYAEKPGALRRRLRTCWTAGRREFQAFEQRHPAALAETTRVAGGTSAT